MLFETLNIEDVVATDGESAVFPGSAVRHRHDYFSFGIVIANEHGVQPAQKVKVLWTYAPKTITVTELDYLAPRLLNTRWTQQS